jgi:DNA-binding NarL/FixJ family response regulator
MATTSKEINLQQLDQELGSQGLVADFNDANNKIIKPADNSTVTETELEDAIEAHIAGPTEQEVKVLNRQQGIVKLNELGFTNEQITALLEISEEEIVAALAG